MSDEKRDERMEMDPEESDVKTSAEDVSQDAVEPGAVEDGAADSEAQGDEDQEPDDVSSELAEMCDRYARLQAEWDNYRKRTAAEREQERSRATEKLVTNLLQVVDDLERAIDNAPGGDDDPMVVGVKAVYNKLCDLLSREGLEVVDPMPGDAFDIQLHQAVSTVDDMEQPDESIEQVYQKGYTMGGKILRPAMVSVTKGGPARPKEDASEKE